MDNKIGIKVDVDDDTDRGFAGIRAKAKKFGSDIVDDVKKVGSKIGDTISKDAISNLAGKVPAFAQVGGILGAAMAPTLGAAIGAGLVGVGGSVGIAGGLVMAARDPAVQKAFTNLGVDVSGDLQEAAAAFVPAALDAIDQARGAFKKMLPDIRAIFSGSASFVKPLLDGITVGVGSIIKGIRVAVEGGRPVFEAFGRLFAEVGNSMENLFKGIADDGPAMAAGLDDVTSALTHTVDAVGALINGLTELKGVSENVDDGIDEQRYRLEDQVSWLDLTADGYEKGSEAAELYRKGLIGVAGSANDYNHYLEEQKAKTDAAKKSTQDQTSALKDLSDAMTAQTNPLFALIDGQKAVSDAQKDYNTALKKHGPNSAEAKDAMARLGKAAFDLTGDVSNVAKDFNGELTPAMRTALSNAGLTQGQIRKLEGQLKTAAAAARRWEGTFTQTYVTSFETFGKPYSQEGIARGQVGGLAHGGIKGAASGMLGEGMTWVGENGPELVDLPPGAHVQSNPDSKRLVARASGGNGMGTNQPIIINLQIGDETVASAILPALQAINRTQFAGDVTRMFPATR